MTFTSPTAPLLITTAHGLTEQKRQLLERYLSQLPTSVLKIIDAQQPCSESEPVPICAVVDGRHLACPLPLLRTKVALREIGVGEGLYVVATDPNSTADIAAFCRQSRITSNVINQAATGTAALKLLLQAQSTESQDAMSVEDQNDLEASVPSDTSTHGADTFFHFIITKTDSNSD